MSILRAVGVIFRLYVLVAGSWALVAFTSPYADPFINDLAWVVLVGVVLAIPVCRRTLSTWVSTGRLKRVPA